MVRRLLPLVLCAVAIVACSTEEKSKNTGGDAGFVGRASDTEEPDPVDPGPVDPGPTPDASTGGDSSTGTCTGKILINELLTEGGAFNKEFIELYNPSTCDVVIEGFKLSYKSASGTPAIGTPLHTFAAGTTIKGKGYYVVGTPEYTGKKDTTFSATGTGNGYLSNNGQVALFDAAGVKLDGLGYGTLTGGDYVETKAAPVAPATASIARKSDGLDTDDNSKDCDWQTTPTPGAKNGL
jgi:predicted extracellular nuclease